MTLSRRGIGYFEYFAEEGTLFNSFVGRNNNLSVS